MWNVGRFSHNNLFWKWKTCEPGILVWYWCPVNGQQVDQLSWYGIGALWMGSWWTSYPGMDQLFWYGTGALWMDSWWASYPGMELVLVVQLYWFRTEVLWCGHVWILDYWFVNSTWKMIVNMKILWVTNVYVYMLM